MSDSYRSIAFTDHVRDAQVAYGSRPAQSRLEHRDVPVPTAARDALGELERRFLAGRDGFYVATVSDSGWPYVQFRGGPPGFVRTPDEHTVAWGDFRGNRQYVTAGNLGHDDRVAMIFLDYATQNRLKVYGRARVVDVRRSDEGSTLAVPGYSAVLEREIYVDVAAYDWNCEQHIVPRFSLEELARWRHSSDAASGNRGRTRYPPDPSHMTEAVWTGSGSAGRGDSEQPSTDPER